MPPDQSQQSADLDHSPQKRSPNMALVAITGAIIVFGSAYPAYRFFVQEGGKTATDKPTIAGSDPAMPDTTNDDNTQVWQTYRNEEYGLEFKYPVGSSVENLDPWQGGPGTFGAYENPPYLNLSVTEDIKLALGGYSCLSMEAGQDPLISASFLLGSEIKDLVVDGFHGKIFERGCYECYEGDSRLSTSGAVAVVCNNRASACLVASINAKSEDFLSAKSMFINDFLRTIRLAPAFNDLKCGNQSKG